MLIYEMRHMPTGKVYIGALKDSNRWLRYNTSSKTVRAMMQATPQEWTRHILLDKFCADVAWADVVALEQKIIEITAKTIGWDKMWNGGVYKGQAKMAAVNEDEVVKKLRIEKTKNTKNSFSEEKKQSIEKRRVFAIKNAWTKSKDEIIQKRIIARSKWSEEEIENFRKKQREHYSNLTENQKEIMRLKYKKTVESRSLKRQQEIYITRSNANKKNEQQLKQWKELRKIAMSNWTEEKKTEWLKKYDPTTSSEILRKQKISLATKGIPKQKVICPHCSMEGGISQMKRWHFNNCKQKPVS